MSKFLALGVLGLCVGMGQSYAQTATYEVEPDHSFVTFEVVHNGTSTTRGRFDSVVGTVELDQTAQTGRTEIHIDPASINSGSKGFDEHLRNKDFFNVAAFPEVSFKSTTFIFDGTQVTGVSGTLTLLGVQNPVTLEANHFNCYQNKRIGREVCGGDFEAMIKRSEWGMNFGLPGIPDTVRLVIQIEAIRQ